MTRTPWENAKKLHRKSGLIGGPDRPIIGVATPKTEDRANDLVRNLAVDLHKLGYRLCIVGLEDVPKGEKQVGISYMRPESVRLAGITELARELETLIDSDEVNELFTVEKHVASSTHDEMLNIVKGVAHGIVATGLERLLEPDAPKPSPDAPAGGETKSGAVTGENVAETASGDVQTASKTAGEVCKKCLRPRCRRQDCSNDHMTGCHGTTFKDDDGPCQPPTMTTGEGG